MKRMWTEMLEMGGAATRRERIGEPAPGTHVTGWVNLDSQFTQMRRQG